MIGNVLGRPGQGDLDEENRPAEDYGYKLGWLPVRLGVALSCRVRAGKCLESVPLWGWMHRKLLSLESALPGDP